MPLTSRQRAMFAAMAAGSGGRKTTLNGFNVRKPKLGKDVVWANVNKLRKEQKVYILLNGKKREGTVTGVVTDVSNRGARQNNVSIRWRDAIVSGGRPEVEYNAMSLSKYTIYTTRGEEKRVNKLWETKSAATPQILRMAKHQEAKRQRMLEENLGIGKVWHKGLKRFIEIWGKPNEAIQGGNIWVVRQYKVLQEKGTAYVEHRKEGLAEKIPINMVELPKNYKPKKTKKQKPYKPFKP